MSNSLGSSISFYITVAEKYFFAGLDRVAEKYQLDRSSVIRFYIKRGFQEEGWLDDDLLPIPRAFKKEGFPLPDPMPTRNQPGLKRFVDTCEFITKGEASYKDCRTNKQIEAHVRALMKSADIDVIQVCVIDATGARGPHVRYSRAKNGSISSMPINDNPL